jgi:hypothetical protein
MTIFNTLSKHYGGRYKAHKGDIGLEVETESREDYAVPKFSFWEVHRDDSLRDVGKEYVLRQPLDFEITFPKALDEFKEKTTGIKFIEDSITTSIHTHLNFLNDNFITLGNFLTTYTWTENLLIRASGEDRKSNLFCLPICDAEETYNNMMRMFDGIKTKKYGLLQFEPEHTKYGAINLSSLTNFGSLEIRSFRGTVDTELIKQWVGTLYSILKYARTPGLIPPQIILAAKDRGPELLTDIFGEYRKFIRHPDEEKLLEKNFWYAANIAYSVKDWPKLEEVPKPKKPKPKDLDNTAQKVFGHKFQDCSMSEQRAILRHLGEEVPEEDEMGREEEQPRDDPFGLMHEPAAQAPAAPTARRGYQYVTEGTDTITTGVYERALETLRTRPVRLGGDPPLINPAPDPHPADVPEENPFPEPWIEPEHFDEEEEREEGNF